MHGEENATTAGGLPKIMKTNVLKSVLFDKTAKPIAYPLGSQQTVIVQSKDILIVGMVVAVSPMTSYATDD